MNSDEIESILEVLSSEQLPVARKQQGGSKAQANLVVLLDLKASRHSSSHAVQSSPIA